MSTKILAVSGEKNSGKTTLIERLLPTLVQNGLRVSVIKHDGHRFSADVPGTDTCRFLAAGAAGTAVYDREKYMVVQKKAVGAAYLTELFPDADLILIEGLKYEAVPKLFLLDGQVSCSFSAKRFSRDDIPALSALIAQYAKGGDCHA